MGVDSNLVVVAGAEAEAEVVLVAALLVGMSEVGLESSDPQQTGVRISSKSRHSSRYKTFHISSSTY